MLDQTRRIARLKTPLGENVLSIARLDAREGLSELFEFDIEAVSELEDIDFDKLIGQPCSVTYDAMGVPDRVFHGVLTQGQWTGVRNELFVYRLTLRPWLWLLGKTTDCRIFHEKTAVDIIRETFAGHGFSDFRLALTASYPALHYTVQYRETDLNFVSRLMEQHGIYYYFEHEAGLHRLVLADSIASHAPVPGLAKIPFNAHHETPQRVRLQHIRRWNSLRGLRSGRVELNDYNHLKPTRAMISPRKGTESYTRSDMEVYDHPGAYRSPEDGAFYARVRLEAEQAQDRRREAQGDAISLFPGALVTLEKHPRGPENQQYLIVRTHHGFESQEYRSGGSPVETDDHGTYEFLPAERQYRALLQTPKPLVHSLQTALVTGAEGEEIDCDDHGRILVHFYWDRHNDKSCRLRVSQVWGAKTWGGQIIPRIGMEVMVAFIDGDPDRPIVVGTVPDPENNHVPYKLPENKTRMVWRSNSHKSSGFNEFSMEDKTGAENVLLHAQKDFTHKVLNNATQRVDNSSATSIGQHASTEVGGNASHETGGSQTNVVGATGPGVAAAMAPLMGMMGQTASLAGEAAGLAGGLGMIQQLAMGVVGQAAQALLGGAAGGAGGRPGVVGGGSTRPDMGTALAGAGTQLLQGVAQMFGQGGIQKNFVSQAQISAVGQMSTETVGKTKVVHVGSTFFTQVGKKMKIEVGEELEIVVGKSHLVMRKDGSVILNGTRFVFTASGPVEVYGSVIDLNKPG